MLLRSKKIISNIIVLCFLVVSPISVLGDSSVSVLTIDAQINNDNGKVTLSGEHNSKLSEIVSITVFYPGYTPYNFDEDTPIKSIVALMTEVLPQNGTWTYEFTLTDDMPWGDYSIYVGSDVYSYSDLYDTVSFINSERRGQIISAFNVGDDELNELKESFKNYNDVLSIDIRDDWELNGEKISLCFIKYRSSQTNGGVYDSFKQIKDGFIESGKIFDFMQISDSLSLGNYIEHNSMDLGIDCQNTEYLKYKNIILSDTVTAMIGTKVSSYVDFYLDLKNLIVEKMVLHSINNAAKSEMDYLLRKYYHEIGISVLDKYTSLDPIEVAKSLYNKNFASLIDVKIAFENRVAELSQVAEEDDTYEDDKYVSTDNSNFGGGSGGGSSPSLKDSTLKQNETQNDITEEKSKISDFSDVDESFWGYSAISSLAKIGVINGFEDNTFAPQSPVTREQFLKIAVSAFDEMLSKGVNQDSFSDVNSDEWYAEYVQRGVNSGLINGMTEDLFGIGKTISRQDAAVILYRAIKSQIDEIKIYGNFTDNSKISEYAKTPVYSLQNIGILSGNGSGYFNPTDNLTRAEAAQLVYNAMKFCNLFS